MARANRYVWCEEQGAAGETIVHKPLKLMIDEVQRRSSSLTPAIQIFIYCDNTQTQRCHHIPIPSAKKFWLFRSVYPILPYSHRVACCALTLWLVKMQLGLLFMPLWCHRMRDKNHFQMSAVVFQTLHNANYFDFLKATQIKTSHPCFQV